MPFGHNLQDCQTFFKSFDVDDCYERGRAVMIAFGLAQAFVCMWLDVASAGCARRLISCFHPIIERDQVGHNRCVRLR